MMVSRGSLFALLAVLALPGCGQYYESRVRSALMDAGLSRPMAQCMAERMVDRLSTDQLQSLGRLGEMRKGESGGMTSGQFLDRYRRALDPEVYQVLARAGIGCALTV